MPRFAEQTSVAAERSRAEIERTLQRYGADQFLYGWSQESAQIGFRAKGRMVRFVLAFPAPDRGYRTATGRMKQDQQSAREQDIRQRWRALALVIKAKLEAVESGITTFEDEFLAHTLLPSGETVSDWMQPQIEKAYELGNMPLMLAAPTGEGA